MQRRIWSLERELKAVHFENDLLVNDLTTQLRAAKAEIFLKQQEIQVARPGFLGTPMFRARAPDAGTDMSTDECAADARE